MALFALVAGFAQRRTGAASSADADRKGLAFKALEANLALAVLSTLVHSFLACVLTLFLS